MEDTVTAKSVFRSHCHQEDREEMLSVGNRDSLSANSTLKTFSCESDVFPFNSFDYENYFLIDVQTLTQCEPKKNLTQGQKFDYPIVTPPKPSAPIVEISLDPLEESQLHPLLSDIRSDDQKGPARKELGLLLPSTDLGYPTKLIPKCMTSLLFESNRKKDFLVDPVINKEDSLFQNLGETSVYKQLRPSLPLPESIGPILCFLLHMEFSFMVHGTIVSHACEVVNEQWNDNVHELCSSKGNTEKKIQNISARIVDKLVETLGPIVDFPALFQASARLYNNLIVAGDERLLLFFRKEKTNVSEAKKIEVKNASDGSSKPSLLHALDDCGNTVGKKRKDRGSFSDDDEKVSAKKPKEFVRTNLQFAIAYGAIFLTNDNVYKGDQLSLEEFVMKESNHLSHMNQIERENIWNDMRNAWHNEQRDI